LGQFLLGQGGFEVKTLKKLHFTEHIVNFKDGHGTTYKGRETKKIILKKIIPKFFNKTKKNPKLQSFVVNLCNIFVPILGNAMFIFLKSLPTFFGHSLILLKNLIVEKLSLFPRI